MKEAKSSEIQIKIASYNILADCQMRDSLNIKDSFYTPDPKRIKEIIKEIKAINADIYCLQEVERKEELMSFFPLHGFEYKLQIRPNNQEGNCTAWNKSKYELIQYNTLEFKSNLTNTELYNKDNIAQFTILRDRKYNIYYIVANTHLLFNLKRGDIKVAQIYQITKVISKLAKRLKKNKCKVFSFICGDFNSVRNSGIYKLLTEGEIDLTNLSKADISGQNNMLIPKHINLRNLDITSFSERYNILYNEYNYNSSSIDNSTIHYEIINTKPSIKDEMIKLKFREKFSLDKDKQIISLSFPFKSAYYQCNSKEPLFSYYSKAKIGTVDFIFYNSYSDELNITPIKAYDYYKFNDVLSRLISNNIFPSDHIPLAVDFTISS